MTITRVLILGGGGMLGHKLYHVLAREFDTWTTFHSFDDRLSRLKLFDQSKVTNGVDAFELASVQNAIRRSNPQVVINCIGMIKQKKDAQNHKTAIYLNALFPHLLAEMCRADKIRPIHMSTDCVFSGSKGGYHEESISDAEDLYGRTKFLGEIDSEEGLTLRTSIIGHELFTAHSLVNWFFANAGGSVKGYTKAIYTGFPTVILARELVRVIREFPDLCGLHHISSDPISKYELLSIINKQYGCGTKIEPFDDFICDRSLNSDLYKRKTGFRSLSWPEMIKVMSEDYSTSNYYRKGDRETGK